ncbi:SDR family NAD(P)-dependent oxidoreductase [Kineosporia sp. A_224]|uniref:SDR family NAD(P)-dependent oxidoreductase n=1 Tax=Kineosporia sp. A_224 TaxID=1962180 RepID=UPI000B4B9257|nr:SDR family oxidoreductase [Kineosporia sp. A_224]
MTAYKAIVTGASSGIGLATARRIHADGGTVALLATRAGLLEDIAGELGERAFAVPTDVSDPAQVSASIERCFDLLGDVDLVVNAAGVDGPSHLLEMSDEKWGRTISVNLSGPFYVSRESARRLKAGSSIVNIGSELSFMGMGLYVDYCASKAGLIGLTRAMSAELAERNIRVNAICPGPVDTPMMEAEIQWFPDPEAIRVLAVDRVPLKRWASPEEIADAVVYMAGSTFATGAAWSIDGGTTAI